LLNILIVVDHTQHHSGTLMYTRAHGNVKDQSQLIWRW